MVPRGPPEWFKTAQQSPQTGARRPKGSKRVPRGPPNSLRWARRFLCTNSQLVARGPPPSYCPGSPCHDFCLFSSGQSSA
eukprot:2601159-Pyramimonas_sp.AAC.1